MEYLRNLLLIDNIKVIHNILDTIGRYPHGDWNRALAKSQIKSKLWIIDVLRDVFASENIFPKKVYNLASWYNLMALFLAEYLQVESVRSFDIDPNVMEISDRMIYHKLMDKLKYKTIIKDVFDINYNSHSYFIPRVNRMAVVKNEKPDLVINCSCEHMDYKKWLTLIPQGMLVVLQNNNAFHYHDHTHCTSSLSQFINNCNLSNVLYSGQMEMYDYTRFMIVGKK